VVLVERECWEWIVDTVGFAVGCQLFGCWVREEAAEGTEEASEVARDGRPGDYWSMAGAWTV